MKLIKSQIALIGFGAALLIINVLVSMIYVVEMWEIVPQNDYCADKEKMDNFHLRNPMINHQLSNFHDDYEKEKIEVCEHKYKFLNFIVIYYDGLGIKFLKELKSDSFRASKFALNKTNNPGITDSTPAFLTLMSGLLPLAYNVPLKKIGTKIKI